MILGYQNAIAVKIGSREIKTVIVQTRQFVSCNSYHVSKMSNLILVCIREGSHITGSSVSNLK
jgi:hypothetical protein